MDVAATAAAATLGGRLVATETSCGGMFVYYGQKNNVKKIRRVIRLV